MSGFERRSLGSGMWAHVATDLEDVGFLAAFFERTGGSSAKPFDSLNVSFGAGDDPAAVLANRRAAAAALGLEEFPVPGLIHGTTLAVVGRGRMRDGFFGPAEVFGTADGLHTKTPGVPLGAFSADCVIAVMASPGERRVAMVHAGWRGMVAGILHKGAALFENRAEVRVAIGPAIGPCHYEVGEEVASAVATAFPAGAVVDRRSGRWFLDLVGTTRSILREEGIRRVWDTGLCTACESRLLFSFRAEGTTGRHLAVGMRLL
ncbi:MAG: polyphenol oxidase family protein [Actinomycetota bacterium]